MVRSIIARMRRRRSRASYSAPLYVSYGLMSVMDGK